MEHFGGMCRTDLCFCFWPCRLRPSARKRFIRFRKEAMPYPSIGSRSRNIFVFLRASASLTAFSAADWSRVRSYCCPVSPASENRRCLQICQFIDAGSRILYVSGEESPSQIKLRAGRLGVDNSRLSILAETNVNKIIPEIDLNGAEVVVIDSIQTIYDDEVASSPGTVTQVKQTAMRLIHKAKTDGITIVIVGHVNKDGAIAGSEGVGAYGRRRFIF